MCGRYTLKISPAQMMELFGLHQLPELIERYNIAPSQKIPAILTVPNSGERMLKALQWGLIPSWSKSKEIGSKLTNARSETVDEKPSFREAFKSRRCLIPATGFYEWKKIGKEKQPYLIEMKNKQPFAFAGLWERWTNPQGHAVETATILTTAPNKLMQELHDRMPVIITPEHYRLWLETANVQTETAKKLCKPYPEKAMAAYPVAKRVNSPKNTTAECIEPIDLSVNFRTFRNVELSL